MFDATEIQTVLDIILFITGNYYSESKFNLIWIDYFYLKNNYYLLFNAIKTTLHLYWVMVNIFAPRFLMQENYLRF